MSDYLAHYGVLGMKWGVRRYQPYGQGYSGSTGRFIGKKSTPSKSYTKNYEKALGAGYSEDEAKKYAKRKQVLKRVAITAAVVTVAAATAYVAYRHHVYSADKFIDPSVTLKRIARTDSNKLNDMFYAYMKKGDHKRYAGMYAHQVFEHEPQGSVYLKSIKQTGLKVASEKNALNVLKEVLATDKITGHDRLAKEIAKDAKIEANNLMSSDRQRAVARKALQALKNGKPDKNVYEFVNSQLVYGKYGETAYQNAFSKALRKAGYDAVMDINDKKLSGYGSKLPLIVLEASKASVDSVSKIDKSTADRLFNSLTREVYGRRNAASIGFMVTSTAAISAASYVVNERTNIKVNTQLIDKYKTEHPNTELSNKEIIEQIYNTPISKLSF